MRHKIEKEYIYKGLGFPITLYDVEMVKIEDDLHPVIDVEKVAEKAIKSLVLQKKRLTGNQIKFIRTYFSMSLRGFAKVVNESHMAIKKWEDYKDKQTRMDDNIEIMLRLHIYDQVVVKDRASKNEKVEFYNHFRLLKETFSHHTD